MIFIFTMFLTFIAGAMNHGMSVLLNITYMWDSQTSTEQTLSVVMGETGIVFLDEMDKVAKRTEGTGADVLGDPRQALAWLVNEVTGHGLIMRAKEFVTTGTATVPLPILEGDRVTAAFGELGTIAVRIAP